MLFYLTGSSCSGKSTAARICAATDDLDVHDTDEVGVPSDADLRWRQETLEVWVRQALRLQGTGVDMLLTGQSPLGEILAVPSAPDLDGIAVCLVDVADRDRWIRLERRDPGSWSDEAKRSFIGWARWHRGHAGDPRHRPEVIIDGSWPEMDFSRWTDWPAGDPRWRTATIDTTGVGPEQTALQVAGWIESERARRGSIRTPRAPRQAWVNLTTSVPPVPDPPL